MPMSASAVIGALRVNLGLDSASFQKGVARSTASLGTLKGAAMAASAAVSAIGAAIGGPALASIVTAAARSAREITRLSQVAGASAQELQHWSFGARTVGLEQEKLADILKDVNDKVGDYLSTGGGAMADFFERIAPRVGVTAQAFRDLSGPQALQLYVSSLEKAGLSQAEMTFYMEAIASDSTLLLPLLRANGAEMARLGESASSFGAVLGTDAITALRAAQRALDDISVVLEATRNRIAADLAPAVEAMVRAFVNSMREGGFLRGVIDGLMAALPHLTAYAAAFTAGLIAWQAAALAARLATMALSVSMAGLRAAIAATGVGVLVVAMGELGLAILDAVRKAGGFAAAWYKLKAKFFEVLRDMAGGWVEFTWALADGMNDLFGTRLMGADAGITQTLRDLQIGAEDAAAAAQEVSAAATEAEGTLTGLGGAGSGAGKKVRKGLTEAQKAAQAFADALRDGVRSSVEGAVDWMLDGFQGGFKGLVSLARDALKQVVALFLKNRITLSLGLGVSGGAAAGAAVSGAAAGGFAGPLGLLGTAGSFLGAIGSGAAGLGTALFGAGGGLGAAGTYLSSVVGSATSSLGAFGAAIGAALPILAGVGVVFSFFKKKVTQLDAGLRLTVTDMDTLVETFSKTRTSRFWGLSKKTRETFTEAAAAIADPIEAAVAGIVGGVADMADTLGIAGRDALKGFATQIRISTHGLSDNEAQEAIRAGFTQLSDALARMILAAGEGVSGNLSAFTSAFARRGESASETLTRLSSALATANAWLDRLGKTAYDTSLAGADAASKWAGAFGGLEAMSEAVSAYYAGFYSPAERLAQAREELSQALAGLGIDALPGSRQAFRQLIDAAFASGDKDLAAKLIQLAPAMAEITDQAQALTAALKDLDTQSLYRSGAEALYAATSEGHRRRLTGTDATVQGLLAEVVRAIREGDINNARLTARLLAVQERMSLDPAR
ncbi:potassium-transporting ATPase subunit G [Rhodobacter capsulatus YW2]|nr:potassium-transporting ATPase subunit G [Rhodobacter capsulatus YW2]